MIKVRHLSKSFNNRLVLDDINIDFEKGKTNLIIGQSGSGKTVLLKSLVGLHSIDSGQILYGDANFPTLGHEEKKEIRKQIGMLFQGSALFDSQTVEENVMFPLTMFTENSYHQNLERVNFCLKRVNLENVNKRYPAEISGGMKKRVAIARAISLNPQYLFCDEPNSGLDPLTSIVIDNLIKEITQEYDMTTIINTHDMNSVLEIGDKVIYIYQGKKTWEGSSEDIMSSDNKYLNDFVFASPLSKKLKRLMG
jgi:phospholipid/cholesterol/gamma-HCH transport system ATP-binding protein